MLFLEFHCHGFLIIRNVLWVYSKTWLAKFWLEKKGFQPFELDMVRERVGSTHRAPSFEVDRALRRDLQAIARWMGDPGALRLRLPPRSAGDGGIREGGRLEAVERCSVLADLGSFRRSHFLVLSVF